MSNQAFAQATNQGVIHSVSFVTTVPETLQAAAADLHEIGSHVEKTLAGAETHVGKTLEGQQRSHPGLGNNPTPYPTPIPGEETQLEFIHHISHGR